ncbi:solute carrier family 26 member 10-like isoform X2 [Phymastichus coffea]|uniref:solute carrier family 26 member 10-like isoform X2 n=1 Tax=Phymastichus coffea TaxID=108790 RepID=UPI00273CE39F|nr:solute carrier family 26 member 10-like isoform X2 [Phymastichus coffea]
MGETSVAVASMATEEACDETSAIMPEFVVRRPVYQQDDLHRLSQYSNPQKPLSKTISNTIKKIKPESCMKSIIPILNWLPRYRWKNDIFGDIVAGITVAVMHIPQGMAYAILGNVKPIVGIYMAIFPVLIYLIFGTSRHNSMGTFAVICMMTGKIVLAHTSPTIEGVSNSTISPSTPSVHVDPNIPQPHFTPEEVATAVAFMVAIMQLAMYFLRLGIISSLLSETLVSGFTTAAAVHVLTSQIKDLFGLKLAKRKGIFKVLLTYYDIFKNIDSVNTTAMVISAITVILILFNNEILKPRLAKRCAFPVPIEMIVVVLGTLVSMYAHLETGYNVSTVGHIDVGFPEPKLPPMELMPNIILDSFVITMVTYTISMSMAFIFAQKLNYKVDPNQELFAQGLGNLTGSFFSCMPFCASLSRSLIQQTVGGRTQLASLISSGLLLLVLLYIGPFFEPLPRCVLASIIIVALKGMLMQVKDFIRFLRLSNVDAMIWMTSFLTVTIFDIEYGLLIGALLCLANLLTLSMRPYVCRLALVPGTELYLDTKRFKGTVEIPSLKIIHYCGGLNFASRHSFKKDVIKLVNIDLKKELMERKCNVHIKDYSVQGMTKEGYENAAFEKDSMQVPASDSINQSIREQKLKVIILDFSALVHIDAAGVATVRCIVDDFAKIDVTVYITGCSGPVYETMRKCNAAESKEGYFTMFPTVNDAVNFARHKNRIPPLPVWTATQSLQPNENCISRFSIDNGVTSSRPSRTKTRNKESDAEQNLKNTLNAEYGTFSKQRHRE